ncbi:LiaF transmembrane domain-containing protein [Segetibacter aerophilus]|uniref:Membrane protein n=1 Tax=Segetibacter aerophilus TaxID=670293 RepID=A0A512BIV7_9BACT|nr:LiaF domain-containing protein [Segetibacter aerophilus]GEO11909.1 membrane protein [Segetibacter aerophilus]
MEQDQYKSKGRISTGLFLVGAGVLLFAFKMGAPLPAWLFSWPVLLISIGLLIGIRHNFKNPGGFILIIIGSLNLVDRLNPNLNFQAYIAPLIFILLGLVFIFKPSRTCKHGRKRRIGEEEFAHATNAPYTPEQDEKKNDDADYINSISVFGGVKKNILTKNFKGGEITCFMGGAEFNLSQADIQHHVVLEVTQVFGGTKLIVPANWHVKTEVVTVFGGIEDKRPLQAGNINYDKVLELVGTTVFGGIDIRSY